MLKLTLGKLPLLFLVTFAISACSDQTQSDTRPVQDIHVDTMTLSYNSLRLNTELPGRITAFNEAEVRPQITGIVQSRLYKEGSYVTAGDVLFQIDPTTYQSTVNSAQAELKKALASEQSTQKAYIRYQALMKKSLTSQELLDDAESSYLQAKAEVAIRQAELDYANIELSYTQIRAPISGYAGFSQVSEGSLLTSGQSDYLTTIIQTNNVYVDMQQSSVSLYKLRQEFMNVRGTRPTIPVTITLEDGTLYQHTGKLEFADTRADNSTGSVTLRAIIPNPDNSLLAGMYVRANISMPEQRNYLVVPQSVVVRSQAGAPSVFVVDKDNKITKRAVELGNEVGNGWVVKTGLNVGDNVVVNNLNKLQNNQIVVVDSQTEQSDQTATADAHSNSQD
ncbi:efflux RND transporter periplasmic adaptor subunit [Shewanella saliphila]|uniref:MexE family multidrug efflux RND transporter periplasmic adaptor subunit n=1 Tax=Shewanella saliphila TaxID=2282698 RepID=A0ABQ2Q8V1_9GAMM|nr:efflux RND transporter periplasmic adaptor subunit [Shewanella saliphila]MCL1100873.1 efflux RND transporter periplasmic adaptor subunit [Shewanella saliphila]GGP60523.1 MexE family multidrug efflux RND transporter periplasmic adaptor subunit [Shewanella saliphila]